MNEPNVTLYLVTSSSDRLPQTVEAACRGGVTMVQLREKKRGGRELLQIARSVKAVTDKFRIPLIINDRADIALACGAAGVHLGGEDIPIADARRILGGNMIIGATAKTAEAALKAQSDGADYLGVGAVFPSKTKDAVITSVETLGEICRAVSIPVCAIGGLDGGNCKILRGSGVSGMAAVSAIMNSSDPERAAADIRKALNRYVFSENLSDLLGNRKNAE